MKILCHRGYWKEEKEKNTFNAIKNAFESGRGIESDIRDLNGRLVISHNPADQDSAIAEEIFRLMQEYGDKYCFAINIKADGLKEMLISQFRLYQVDNYFTFDMSVPQMIEYREEGIRYFTRQSEYEKELVLYEDAAGIWMDAFADDSWITEELLLEHQRNGKKICIVSPDLHQKPYEPFWDRLLKFKVEWNGIFLCTDYPDEADSFFGEII